MTDAITQFEEARLNALIGFSGVWKLPIEQQKQILTEISQLISVRMETVEFGLNPMTKATRVETDK